MKRNIVVLSVSISILMFVLILPVTAQFDERISRTLGNTSTTSIANALINKKTGGKVNSEVVKFTPNKDSDVPQALADAFGQDANQKAALVQAFQQIKQGYEAEVAKQGKSNNLAAALTFFITANVMTYGQTEMPADKVTDELFDDLQSVISSVPAFAEMTDNEKQKMHDWLVCMGGFAMMNYIDAKQSGDAQALANIKTFADYSLRLVLGIEANKLRFSTSGLNISADSQSGNHPIIGTWATSSSSPVGMAGTIDATRKQMVSAGTLRLSYSFDADGTYIFKSERSPTSNVWWTIEETGTYSLNGNSLTVIPKTSKATLRNLSGVVQETKNNPLEKVTYQWKTHYFAGNRELNLVLEPPQATDRDGVLGTNSLFPNAYLYVQGFKPAWRF